MRSFALSSLVFGIFAFAAPTPGGIGGSPGGLGSGGRIDTDTLVVAAINVLRRQEFDGGGNDGLIDIDVDADVEVNIGRRDGEK